VYMAAMTQRETNIETVRFGIGRADSINPSFSMKSKACENVPVPRLVTSEISRASHFAAERA
jgi:hypothetical protein